MNNEKKISANASAKVDFSITFTLTKGEAKALEAIAGYGADAFLEVFYQLGTSYLKPYETEMRNLFSRISIELPKEISKISKAQTEIGKLLTDFK